MLLPVMFSLFLGSITPFVAGFCQEGRAFLLGHVFDFTFFVSGKITATAKPKKPHCFVAVAGKLIYGFPSIFGATPLRGGVALPIFGVEFSQIGFCFFLFPALFVFARVGAVALTAIVVQSIFPTRVFVEVSERLCLVTLGTAFHLYIYVLVCI